MEERLLKICFASRFARVILIGNKFPKFDCFARDGNW